MNPDERQTRAAVPRRRDPAAGRPLGTLLLAKALDLTADEAAELRANVSEASARGVLTMLRESVAAAKEGAWRWLEKSK